MKESHLKSKGSSGLIYLLLLYFPLCSCEKLGVMRGDRSEDDSMEPIVLSEDCFAKVDSTEWVYSIPEENIVSFTGVEAVKRRAQQMAFIRGDRKGTTFPVVMACTLRALSIRVFRIR
jgi:hypothetical protein